MQMKDYLIKSFDLVRNQSSYNYMKYNVNKK